MRHYFLASLLIFTPIAVSQLSIDIETNTYKYTGLYNVNPGKPNINIPINFVSPNLMKSALNSNPRVNLNYPLPPKPNEIEKRYSSLIGTNPWINIVCNLNIKPKINFNTNIGLKPIVYVTGTPNDVNPNEKYKIKWPYIRVNLILDSNIFGNRYYKTFSKEERGKTILEAKGEEIQKSIIENKPLEGKPINVGFSNVNVNAQINKRIEFNYRIGNIFFNFPFLCGVCIPRFEIPLNRIIESIARSACSIISNFGNNLLSISFNNPINVNQKMSITVPSYVFNNRFDSQIELPPLEYEAKIKIKASRFCLDYVTTMAPLIIILLLLSNLLSKAQNDLKQLKSHLSNIKSRMKEFYDIINNVGKIKTIVTPKYDSNYGWASNDNNTDLNCNCNLKECYSNINNVYAGDEEYAGYEYDLYNYVENKKRWVQSLNTKVSSCNKDIAGYFGFGSNYQYIISNSNKFLRTKGKTGKGNVYFNSIWIISKHKQVTYVDTSDYRFLFVYKCANNIVNDIRDKANPLILISFIAKKIDKEINEFNNKNLWLNKVLYYSYLVSSKEKNLLLDYVKEAANLTYQYVKSVYKQYAQELQYNNSTELREKAEELYNEMAILYDFYQHPSLDSKLIRVADLIVKYWDNTSITRLSCSKLFNFLINYYKNRFDYNKLSQCKKNLLYLYQLSLEVKNGYAKVVGENKDQIERVLKNFANIDVSKLDGLLYLCDLGNSNMEKQIDQINAMLGKSKKEVDSLIANIRDGKMPSLIDIAYMLANILAVLYIVNSLLMILAKIVFPILECAIGVLIPGAAAIPFVGAGAVSALLLLKDSIGFINGLIGNIQKLLEKITNVVSDTYKMLYDAIFKIKGHAKNIDNCCVSCWDKLPKEAKIEITKSCIEKAKLCDYDSVKCALKHLDGQSKLAILKAYGDYCLRARLYVNSPEDFRRVAKLVGDKQLNEVEEAYAVYQLQQYIEKASIEELKKVGVKYLLYNQYLEKKLYPYAFVNGKLYIDYLPEKIKKILSS
ncbi:NEQ391 [Nanoarchaeum equitans Kin4-M]|uniref:NEQ391 n=1 Tax=Nanoarchaeum equitans (strain Kin4-M) TaxID=228908 RepID=Q74MD1_NANEQ|nr:NEQ391 [Nanoarchaeum equitans Kin4-M]